MVVSNPKWRRGCSASPSKSCELQSAWRAVLGAVILLVASVAPTPGQGAEPVAASDAAERVADPEPTPTNAQPRPTKRPLPSRATINQLVEQYARQHRLDVSLVHAVIRAESSYNPRAVSPAGAIGLMQIMPATAAMYGIGSADALFDAKTNVRVGTRHLNLLIGRHGIGKAIMAYNAGEGALARHNGFVTYRETQRYTHRVLTEYLKGKGIDPYSTMAKQLTGIALSPAMVSGQASRATAGADSAAAVVEPVAPPPRLRELSTLSSRTLSSQSLKSLRASSSGAATAPRSMLQPRAMQRPN